MRSTVRIDDDLMQALKEKARAERNSLSRTLNRVVRAGLQAPAPESGPGFVQRTVRLGPPGLDVTKALSIAAALEDEAILAKLAARK